MEQVQKQGPRVRISNWWAPGHMQLKRVSSTGSLTSQNRGSIWRCLSFWHIFLLGSLNFPATHSQVAKNSIYFITWSNKREPYCVPWDWRKQWRTPFLSTLGVRTRELYAMFRWQLSQQGFLLPFPFCKASTRKWPRRVHDSALGGEKRTWGWVCRVELAPLLYKLDHTCPAVI